MIELKTLNIDVRIIGKTNVVLTLSYESASAQLNMRKAKNKWEYTCKKDTLDWRRVYENNREQDFAVKYRINMAFGKQFTIDVFIIPKLEEYLYNKEVEKILLH